MTAQHYTLTQLHELLLEYERELVASGKAESTVRTYVERTERFLKWLAGTYKP